MPLPGGARSSAMPAYLPLSNALATKLITAFPANVARGLPTIQAIIVLNDPESGVPLAVMDGATITGLRTAAASVLATRVLARPEASALAVLGAGLQARTHLRAMAHARRLSEVRVWTRRPESAERLAAEARAWLETPIRFTPDAESAVHGAEIVATVSSATEPILSGSWLMPGTHICGVGSHARSARELDTLTVARASVVAVDTRDGCLAEAGDLLIPAAEGAFDVGRIVEVGEILLGRASGRTSNEEITLYKSVGMAAMDTAAAALAYEKARELGIGLEVTF